METEGLLGTIDPLQAFVELWRSKFTGALRFERGSVIKIFYFQDGVITSATSNDPPDQVGEIFKRHGKLSEEQLASVPEEAGRSLGERLIAAGMITRKQLLWALKMQLIEMVSSILYWDDGSYSLVENYISKRSENVSFLTQHILLELILRTGDRKLIVGRIVEPTDVLERVADRRSDYAALDLSKDADAIVSKLDGAKNVSEIAATAKVDEFSVFKLLGALKLLGVLAAPGAPPVSADADAGALALEAPALSLEEALSAPAPALDLAAPLAAPAAQLSFDFNAGAPALELETTAPLTLDSAAEPAPEAPAPLAMTWSEPPAEASPEPPPEPEPEQEAEAISVPEAGFEADDLEEMGIELPADTPARSIERQIGQTFEERAAAPSTPTARLGGAGKVALDFPESTANRAPKTPKPYRPPQTSRRPLVAGLLGLLFVGAGVAAWKLGYLPIGGASPSESNKPEPSGPAATKPLVPAIAPPAPSATTTPTEAKPLPTTSPVEAKPLPTTSPAEAKPIPTSSPAETKPTPPPEPKPVPPAPVPGKPVPAVGTSALVTKGQAFAAEAKAQPKGTFTIQLLSVCEEKSLENVLTGETSDFKIWFAPVDVKGRTCFRIFAGRFPSAAAATKGLETVPAKFREGGAKPTAVPIERAYS